MLLRINKLAQIISVLSVFGVPAAASNLVFVQTEADLPAPIGGVSTLLPKTYIPANADGVDVSFRIKYADPRTVILGFGRQASTFRFTNTSVSDANIINDAGISVAITGVTIESPDAPLFDCVGGATALFSIKNSIIDNCADLGSVEGFVRTEFGEQLLIGFNVTGGLDILGASTTVVFSDVQTATDNATPLFSLNDAGLTIGSLQISDCTGSRITGTHKFADIDPTKVTEARLLDCRFGATATEPLGANVDNATTNFIIIDVKPAPEDTRKIGELNLNGPQAAGITLQGTPVVLGGTWTGAQLSQFEVDGAGLKYIGETSGETWRIIAKVNGEKPGGTGSETYQGQLLVGGSPVGSAVPVEISDKGGTISLNAFHAFVKDTTITIELSDETATTDLTVLSSNIETHRIL